MAVPTAQARSTRASAPSLGYLPALDGLRAVAVLAVMLYHGGVGWARGGYLGVDVFFVLSGYLITSLLLREWTTRRSIDLVAFWGRRARRLLPALFLMLLGVIGYTLALAPPVQDPTIRGQGLSTLLYVSNWWMILHQESYFAQFLEPSPLAHTWSLAIEEQWYLVFPLGLAGMLAARRGRVRSLAHWLAGLAVASALWMAYLFDSAGDTSRAYLGTDTRVQDLLVGAALAAWLAGPRRDRGQPRLAQPQLIGATGLVGVLLAMVLVDDQSQLPYRGGFLAFAALCAAVVASAASAEESAVRRLLAWEPLRLVGLISYGLYLWHWPLFVALTPARTGLDGIPLLVLRFTATFAVAIASFLLIERPIRQGALDRRLGAAHSAYAAVVSMVVIGSLLVAATPGRSSLFAQPGTGASQPDTGASQPGAGPTLAPAGEGIHTRFGGGISTFFVGDSVPYGLRVFFEPEVAPGIWLNGSSRLGCGLIPQAALIDGKLDRPTEGCAQWAAGWPAEVAAVRPDLAVLFLGTGEQFDKVVDGRTITFGSPAYGAWLDSYLDTALGDLAAHSEAVAVMNVPCHRAYEDGLNAIPTIINDQSRIDWLNAHLRRYQARAVTKFAIIDFNDWLCVKGDPSYRGSVHMRGDGLHFTQEGAALVWTWLGPELRSAFRGQVGA